MRPTAEGLEEEEKREKQRQAGRDPEPTAAPSQSFPEPPPLAESLNEPTAETEPQPDWIVEPAEAPEAPIFATVEPDLTIPQPQVLEEPHAELHDREAEEEVYAEAYRESESDDDEAFDAAGGPQAGAELEGKEGDKEEDAKAESRKRRSRGRRGGRRKANGKPAGALADSADDDEDDEPFHDEPAFEELPPPPRPEPVARHEAARHEPARRAQTPAPVPQRHAPAPVAPFQRAGRSSESYVISQSDLDTMSREIIISVPDRRPASDERKIALFCDLENIALGVRDSEISKFDIDLVLERLLEKGKIIVKKAYADWERYSDYKRPFHEAAIELIDIPQKFYSGKNSADIKMVVDAMDLSYSKEHLDTFVLLSGDSDFSPLVSKLKENNKYVIGIGVKNSSSNLLVDNCDEFIYYEDVWRDAQAGPKLDGLNKKTAEAFSLMVDSIQALLRENKDVLWGSMIKQTMQRKKPSFNEGYYGYSTFSELLEDAERKSIIKLKKDQRSGTYIVTGFAKSEGVPTPGRR